MIIFKRSFILIAFALMIIGTHAFTMMLGLFTFCRILYVQDVIVSALLLFFITRLINTFCDSDRMPRREFKYRRLIYSCCILFTLVAPYLFIGICRHEYNPLTFLYNWYLVQDACY